jgi:hypothetical protein
MDAVSVFFPNEPSPALLVAERHAVDGTSLLRNEGPMIAERAGRLLCAGYSDGKPVLATAPDVIDKEPIVVVADLWRPEISNGPLRSLRKNVSYNFPVH